jgi:hypothetical protein
MELNERISYVIASAGINASQFARSIGTSKTMVHNYIAGRGSKPSFDVLAKILLVYPQISCKWLILGQGSPFVGGISPLDARIRAAQPQAQDTRQAHDLKIELLTRRVLELEEVLKTKPKPFTRTKKAKNEK